jgi:hypothetical protein
MKKKVGYNVIFKKVCFKMKSSNFGRDRTPYFSVVGHIGYKFMFVRNVITYEIITRKAKSLNES